MTDLEELALTDHPGLAPGLPGPRPLVLLGGAAASVLVVGAVLLARHHAAVGPGLSRAALILLWVLVVVASLLLLGAVSGLLAHVATRWRIDVPDGRSAHDQQAALGRLRRGEEVPAELRDAAQQALDHGWPGRWAWLFPALGVSWLGMAAASEGRELWFRLALGLGYLVLSVQPLRERRRVLRAAARSGLRARRRPRHETR